MELREWLIVLGLALVSLIVIDGIRRLQRQRRVPQLDQATGTDDLRDAKTSDKDPEEAQREAELSWELPNGGARVLKPADYSGLSGKPKLERQAHPGPSRVLSEFRRMKETKEAPSRGSSASASQAPTAESSRLTEPTLSVPPASAAEPTEHVHETNHVHETDRVEAADSVSAAEHADAAKRKASEAQAHSAQARSVQKDSLPEGGTPPSLSAIRADEDDVKAHLAQHSEAKRRQLRHDIAGEREQADHDDEQYEEDSYRLVDFDGIKQSLKERMTERRKAKQQKKEAKAERAKAQAKEKAERKAREEAQAAAEAEKARLAAEQAKVQEAAAAKTADAVTSTDESPVTTRAEGAQGDETYDEYAVDGNDFHDNDGRYDNVVSPHPTLEKALRHDVCGGHARKTLTNADEVIVISVMSRDKEGFDGGTLLELLMACGLRYSRGMGVFHRFETESPDSELQFSMVNVVKPGSFPIEEMDEFVTPGVTFLMPLPGAEDSSAAFEAMVETAMVVVRHLGGELKDENHSVMTAQTIEFARQRVHEFERRHRLHQQMQAH
ncbi:cell division protein ZipA C-terminal FtsZ-binding domain-containing protein [Halomonas vilamensis]|uniref:Cell division protein ZipA n=1 Tax=Vreelandella vilamensis TaxID=531309 RepID=A0ABU1H4C4_9GAMM|nr:cell division protein ZipA C-terminal FtsZ-binding domain-containing protein [Halomonas vilamensis]MDR5899163.1 cell division protein ZipA C-terminal FtsZ-binding domain-containing protein [Halomonas vilamensis]